MAFVDLRGANLALTVRQDADLREADLRDAILSGPDLIGAGLKGANLTGADTHCTAFEDAITDENTIMPGGRGR